MKLKFQVIGMTCAACSARVEKVTSTVPGVVKVDVNLLKGTMTVDVENAEATSAIIKAVQDAGYQAAAAEQRPAQKQATDGDALKQMKQHIIGSAICLSALMYFTMGHMLGLPLPDWYHGQENAVVAALVQLSLTLPVVYLNRVYFSRGLKALWHRAPNMDSLIAVGSLAALVYGVIALYRMAWAMGRGQWDVIMSYRENLYFESAAMILTLITLGKYLEARAKGMTGDAIRGLMDLRPKTAVVCRGGAEYEVPVEQVIAGDVIVVRSGSSIPVDGTVLEGRGAVDESALTGESLPVEKSPGDPIFAGAINTEGYLLFRADKVGEDTTLSQVIQLVEEAGGSKAPIARLADKTAGVFVPVVMAISLAAFAAWMLAGMGLEFSLSVGIAVLVISCPCALGLATPVAIMVGTGRGAAMGVLFKNAEALEKLHKVDTVVLDKTGTLTVGKPAVTDVIPGQVDTETLLRIAVALESKSEHPFAKAILEMCAGRTIAQTTEYETLPGKGVSAVVDGVRYYGGNLRLMEGLEIHVPALPELRKQGRTPMYFASEEKLYLGTVVAADVLKEDSADAVKAMKRIGMNVVMLTGDNAGTAQAVAESAGIAHVVSDVLPGDKSGAVQRLRDEGRCVLMVGDGINDAPALVTADVGMAIGTGTDIAMESADIVLMNNSLMSVASAIELSKATMRNIRQNLFWAFFYNALGIPIAAGVLYPAFGILLSPMLGAATMSLSSVFVVTNALKLRMFKPKSAAKPHEIGENAVNNKEDAVMETIIKVNGMMCLHCKSRVETVCKGVKGTIDAVVDLNEKQVTIMGNSSVEELKKAIADAGYEVVD